MVVDNIVLITISLIICIVTYAMSHNFEGYVVGGQLASIKDFPHAALLTVQCAEDKFDRVGYTCGSSILNQAIVLTAAHCLESCIPEYSDVIVFVGSKERMGGTPFSASQFKLHEKYDTIKISNDIALVKLQNRLKFMKTVRRVSLTRDSGLYIHTAKVAGWGYINEEQQITAKFLMQVSQRIWERRDCVEELGDRVPEGTICGGEVDSSSYVAQGDSGSALMVRKHIQVGVVSYKIPGLTRSLAVYTEVAHFYDWIQKTAKNMYCHED